MGIPARLFNGLPGVFVPETGHATDGDASVNGLLYRTAAERWLGNGRATHAMSLFSGDREGLAAWSNLDFGTHLIDGARRVARHDGISEQGFGSPGSPTWTKRSGWTGRPWPT